MYPPAFYKYPNQFCRDSCLFHCAIHTYGQTQWVETAHIASNNLVCHQFPCLKKEPGVDYTIPNSSSVLWGLKNYSAFPNSWFPFPLHATYRSVSIAESAILVPGVILQEGRHWRTLAGQFEVICFVTHSGRFWIFISSLSGRHDECLGSNVPSFFFC